jgi:hypothetical protein
MVDIHVTEIKPLPVRLDQGMSDEGTCVNSISVIPAARPMVVNFAVTTKSGAVDEEMHNRIQIY